MATSLATENIALNTQIREDTTPDNLYKLLYIEISPNKYSGYDKKILAQNLHSTEDLLLTCKVCNGIMKDAVTDKGENMCSSCSNYKSFGLYPATNIRNTVNNMQCKCPLTDRGCKWLGTVCGIYDHIKNACPKLLIRCSLKCEAVLHNELLEHHKLCICPNRIVQCEYCKDHLESKQMKAHLCKCKKCGAKIVGKNLATHINTICPMAILECPYAKWGCAIRDIKRKDLEEHMRNNLFEHSNISYKLLTKLQISLTEGLKENKQQKQVSEELQTMLTECSRDIIQQKQVSEELQIKLDNSSRENIQQKVKIAELQTKLAECSREIIKQKQATFGFVTHRSLLIYVCPVLLIILVYYYIFHF